MLVKLESGELFESGGDGQGRQAREGTCGQCRRAMREYEVSGGSVHRGCTACGLLLIRNAEGVYVVYDAGRHVACGSKMEMEADTMGQIVRRCSRCKRGFIDAYGGV